MKFILSILLLWQAGTLFAAFPLLCNTDRCLPTSEARWDNADTIRICALRVEFQPDNLTGTSGSGLMADSTIFPDSLIIDGLPHDNQYFADHLAFVRNYYQTVSHGRTQFVEPAVFPANELPPLRLNYPMWHYNYNTDQELLNQKLVELFVHSIWKADSAGLPLEQYNAFVIFHAGIGKDFSIGFDNTPFDIPSAYISSADLAPYRAQLPTAVTRGIILPEGENQVETLEFGIELSLNGIAVKLFGNWLGLPDLFNTSSGSSGIGRWGMMDQGSGNINALVPAMPDAWSRVYMGWVEPQLVIPGGDTAVARTTYRVGRFGSATASEVLKIPITPREYYLIENRDADADSIGYVTLFDRLGRQMRINRDADRVSLDPAFETAVRADHYDFGVPGSGILIWHIDEDVIEANLDANRVNADADHRGVDLVEADGSQDIGREFGFASAGSGTELGIQEDAWWNGNRTHRDANNNAVIRFTDRSHPSAKLYDGASTFLELTNFSDIADTMSFRARLTTTLSGFPVDFPMETDWRYADIDGDGLREFYFLSGDSLVRVEGDGTRRNFCRAPNDVTFWDVHEPVDIDGDGAEDILFSGISNFGTLSLDSLGRADSVTWRQPAGWRPHRSFPARTTTGVPQSLLVECVQANCEDDEITIYASDFKGHTTREPLTLNLSDGFAPLHVYNVAPYPSSTFLFCRANEAVFVEIQDSAVVARWTIVNPSLSGDATILRYAGENRAVIFLNGYGYVSEGGELLCAVSDCAPPAVDWNGDGVPSGGGERVNASEVRDEDFPHFDSHSAHRFFDLDASGNPDIFVLNSTTSAAAARATRINALQHNTHRFDDFPLAVPGVMLSSSLLTIDSTNTLYFVSELATADRYYYSLNRLPIVVRNGERFAYQNEAAIINVRSSNSAVNNREDWVYCWPNPSKETSHIRITRSGRTTATVSIYDMTGRKVTELSGLSSEGGPFELNWDVSNVESGVYLAVVRVQGDGQSNVGEVKIAVVR